PSPRPALCPCRRSSPCRTSLQPPRSGAGSPGRGPAGALGGTRSDPEKDTRRPAEHHRAPHLRARNQGTPPREGTTVRSVAGDIPAPAGRRQHSVVAKPPRKAIAEKGGNRGREITQRRPLAGATTTQQPG